MAEARSLYRLNGVAHVAGSINKEPTRYIYSARRQQNMHLHDRIVSYLERANLYHLSRLNARWFWLDEPLVSAFIERFKVLADDATEETVRIYARAYIMMLLSTQLFGDKSGNQLGVGSVGLAISLHVSGGQQKRDKLGRPLQLLQSWIFWRFSSLRPREFDTYSFPLASRWATYLPTSDRKEERVVQCRLALDRLGDRDPYASLNVMAVVHPEILIDEHSRLWCLWLDSLIADPKTEEISQDVVQRGSSQTPSRVPMPDVPDNRRDDRSGGDGVGHANHRVRRGGPQRWVGSSGVASGGPCDRPTKQAGPKIQEVPITHVSSSQIYHEIHGQMYDDLAGPTFTMDMDHAVGNSQFYSDFADLIRDDDPPHFQ
ncbi:hypothetical protein Ahy_A09g041585 [Arachis hypogaea]|uniref:Aminotransferase-like plant mobile domain-containing protein n=1 Tax=Arachis hypogaea TaxID=3818 RepID=A0A445BD56_ARAHY|nr:hypothetical protein Ahy_A09g041585 [Arachis hypogaea]